MSCVIRQEIRLNLHHLAIRFGKVHNWPAWVLQSCKWPEHHFELETILQRMG